MYVLSIRPSPTPTININNILGVSIPHLSILKLLKPKTYLYHFLQAFFRAECKKHFTISIKYTIRYSTK